MATRSRKPARTRPGEPRAPRAPYPDSAVPAVPVAPAAPATPAVRRTVPAGPTRAGSPRAGAGSTAAGHRPRRGGTVSTEWLLSFGALVFLLGGTWDVAWHIEVGRDRFLSPPHLLLYGGIMVVLGACGAAFLRAWRRGRRLPGAGTCVGALGAALALASAPVDNTWHQLFGLDVTIVSPPHLMLIGGMAVVAYGALAGFSLAATRRDPARPEALLRSTAASWRARGAETGLYLAAGLLTAMLLAILGEYDFDVSRYAPVFQPIALCGLAAVGLAAALRGGGRVGGATLAAAAYTGIALLARGELALLGRGLPQPLLVLPAALALDLAAWKLAPRLGWRVAPLAGLALAAALLLMNWPYTIALNRVVWTPQVMAAAALPALVAGAAGGSLGWLLGAAVRPLVPDQKAAAGRIAARQHAAPRGVRGAPVPTPPAWDGWYGGAGKSVLAAFAALLIFFVMPVTLNAGAPPTVANASLASPDLAGSLEYTPAVAVVGQPLTVKVTFNDMELLGGSPAVPFETVRAGDVQQGALRATDERGVYQGLFVPREPGRRWLSVYYPGERGRTAASAMFVVYRPGEVTPGATRSPRLLLQRPEPGPDEDLPAWLQPATYAAVGLLLAGEVLAIGWVLRRAFGGFGAAASTTVPAGTPPRGAQRARHGFESPGAAAR